MLITINGPYKKYNQSIAARVKAEVQKLYPDMKVFLYINVPISELEKVTYISHRYNPFLHISSILSQMALDMEETEGENKPTDSCIRNYLNTDDRLVIATEWYSSAIIRVLSHIIQYQPIQETNLAKLISTKDELVDFAFNLVEHFQFIPPDLNIVFIPNEKEMDDDMTHRITCTRTLSKNKARQIKESYANYMNLITNDSRNLFTRNGENYPPVYVMNRSDIILPCAENPINTTIKSLRERYQNFHKNLLEHQCEIKTQSEVVKDINNIVKTYIDIVYKPIQVASDYSVTTK